MIRRIQSINKSFGGIAKKTHINIVTAYMSLLRYAVGPCWNQIVGHPRGYVDNRESVLKWGCVFKGIGCQTMDGRHSPMHVPNDRLAEHTYMHASLLKQAEHRMHGN